jgi:hypothetical protein
MLLAINRLSIFRRFHALSFLSLEAALPPLPRRSALLLSLLVSLCTWSMTFFETPDAPSMRSSACRLLTSDVFAADPRRCSARFVQEPLFAVGDGGFEASFSPLEGERGVVVVGVAILGGLMEVGMVSGDFKLHSKGISRFDDQMKLESFSARARG